MSIKKRHEFSNPLSRLSANQRAKKNLKEQDQDSDSGSSGESGGSGGLGERGGRDARGRVPQGKKRKAYLAKETKKMELQRREMEKDWQRKLARVNDRNHDQDEKYTPEGDLNNGIKNHPWLDSQRFDGVDPDVSPAPPLNTEARREYDNALRLQNQLRHEKRMENMPQPDTAPKPHHG